MRPVLCAECLIVIGLLQPFLPHDTLVVGCECLKLRRTFQIVEGEIGHISAGHSSRNLRSRSPSADCSESFRRHWDARHLSPPPVAPLQKVRRYWAHPYNPPSAPYTDHS